MRKPYPITDLREHKLADALRGVSPERLRTVLAKDATIIMRVSEADKADMQRTAKHLHLTLAEYLTRLHYLAVQRLK